MPLARVLRPYTEHAYTFLRIISGLMFAFHGAQKIFGIFTANQPALFSQIWLGGVIELVAGLCIALGFFTTWVAFVASGTMAVAYVQFHWKLQFDGQFFPAVNKGELALLYCAVFLFIACKGNGLLSLGRRR